MTRTKMRRLIGLVVFGVVAAWGLLGCAASQLTSGFTPVMPSSEHPASAIAVTLSPSQEMVPSPTMDGPTPTPGATEIDATLRAEYAAFATERAMMGVSVVPYETEAAYRTAGALDRTRQAELMYTPTPFGPLPFPGTRLTDEELVERGWPRILDNGKRNEDYHTTAIWLDKAYVDAEIFSKYQALFELLAFRDGPPGEDFEARLRELMLPSEPEGSGLDALVENMIRNRGLASCTFSATSENVSSLNDSGAYVRVLEDEFGYQIVWEYIEDQPAPIGAYMDKAIAFQLDRYYVVFLMTALQNPARPQSLPGLTFKYQKIALQTGDVLQEWVALYEVTQSNESFVAVWRPETADWRFLKYESPYCGDYYPNSLQP